MGSGNETGARSEDIVAQIDETRERLAYTIDALVERTSPKNVARRGLDDFKAKFIDETGSPRLETILPVAGGVAGFIGLLIVIRKIVK